MSTKITAERTAGWPLSVSGNLVFNRDSFSRNAAEVIA